MEKILLQKEYSSLTAVLSKARSSEDSEVRAREANVSVSVTALGGPTATKTFIKTATVICSFVLL